MIMKLGMISASVVGCLLLSTALVAAFSRRAKSETAVKLAAFLSARMRTWWGMAFVFCLAYFTQGVGSILVFAFLSFILLRELITATPTRVGDHRMLLWSFFLVLPCQYALLYAGWYGLFVVLIPVYIFLLVPTMIASTHTLDRFFERVAKIQWALMLCVYCVAHAPALLQLKIVGASFPNAPLLLFLVVVVQARETAAGLINALPRMHPTAKLKTVKWNMTWEGTLIGTAAAVIVGLLLLPISAFSGFQAVALSVAISVMCEASNMSLAGLKADWGPSKNAIIECHGAMIDRVMPLCFAAPVFFHLTRFFCLGAVPVGFN